MDIKHCLSDKRWSHFPDISRVQVSSHSPAQLPVIPLSPVSILRLLGINLSSGLVFVGAPCEPEPAERERRVMFRPAGPVLGSEERDLARDDNQAQTHWSTGEKRLSRNK